MSRNGATVLVLLGVAACGSGAPAPDSSSVEADPGPEIAAMLDASAESWNAGDLEGFLDDYDDSAATTFVGGSGVTRGVAEIRARYLQSFWGDGSPEHALRFDELETRALGSDHVLAIGRYILSDRVTGQTAATGMFSLALARTDGGWKIIHDHSSASE